MMGGALVVAPKNLINKDAVEKFLRKSGRNMLLLSKKKLIFIHLIWCKVFAHYQSEKL